MNDLERVLDCRVPDCVFPSDNLVDIPKLNINKQVQFLEAPFTVWGQKHSRKKWVGGTCLFYTDDYRFEQIWKTPGDILASGCTGAVEPNFSIYDEMPVPVAIYNIYRKRWIARYWQEQGVNVIVDLNVSSRYYGLNMLGVPNGWRAYATHGYNDRIDELRHEHQIACEKAGTDDILFVVYGGGKLVRQLKTEISMVHIEEQRTVARQNIRLNGFQLNLLERA